MAFSGQHFRFSCFVCLGLLLQTSMSQIDVASPSARYVNIASCSTPQSPSQFYNPVILDCDSCSENSTIQKRSSDGLTCECNPGYRYVYNFGGSKVKCQACGLNQAVSDDGWECVGCPNTIDPVTGKCGQCSGAQEIDVLRQLNGQYVTQDSVTCQQCSARTQANDDRSICDRCSISLSIEPRRASCTCVLEERQYRGICFNVTNPPPETLLYTITLDSGDSFTSAYLRTNLLADYYLCKDHQDASACQSLANMCVLTMYLGAGAGTQTVSPTTACGLLLSITSTGATGATLTDLLKVRPQIVVTDDADDVILTNEITTEWTVDPIMSFPFLLATYSLDGEFEGYRDIDGSFLQLCKNTSETILNAAFVFATYYSYSCTIPASSLWSEVTNPLKLYELFLKYTKDGNEWLHRIPIKILNYKDGAALVNEGDMSDWRLVNRFFLVDNQMTKTQSDVDTDSIAPYVRYASSMNLYVELQGSDSKGLIYVPYLEVQYAEVSREALSSYVSASFSVDYSMSMADYNRDFQIAVGVLSSLAVIYSGYRTYVWNKRAGRLTIDFPTLVNFFFYLCNYLGSCFFVIVFGIAFYFFIFFKRQNVVYLVHPEGRAYDEWLALFGSAFALKIMSLVHMILMQCSADIFLVDWERPKGQQVQKMGDEEVKKKKVAPEVSIWRTYFVANEWNELQTHRKINRALQVLAVVFFLHVVEFEDTTTKDPDGTVGKDDGIYRAEQSPMFRMALGALIYIIVDVVQVLFFTLVYERFFTDDIREFVDLCSMSNVSVFVMANAEFGYYIHGRSVHGRSDVGMREMAEMLEREVNNLVGQRGLVPQTEPQTFIMALPKRLRQRYETVYLPVQLENATPANRAEQGRGGGGGGNARTIEAYGVLNRFFCAFIDHSLRDVDYVVKEKSFIEKILDTEFLELTDKGIFYSDNGHSFDNVLFYGNEFSLVIFDTLLFCIIDLIFENFVLAGILTFIIVELVCLARQTGGSKNLAKKTLVDERFLI